MLVPGVHVGGSVFFRFLHRTHRMYRPDFTGSFLCRQYREPSRGLHGANFCLNQLISAPTYAHPVTWHSNASTEDVDAKDDDPAFWSVAAPSGPRRYRRPPGPIGQSETDITRGHRRENHR